jgi:hypothetical protein
MVEDFGNQDQLTIFTDAIFRAGGTAVPLRPVGHQPVERVLDNINTFHVKFQGEWADTSSSLGFRLQGTTGTAYRVARASLDETAVVRYRPRIPVQDWYPIYAFAMHGPDRVPQTYRIVVGGGATEVVVDHRVVGGGWVYLGEYLLPAGDSAYVEIPNTVDNPTLADGRHYVIADAIRFGNGRGDISRGGGISGRLREDEASLYWVGRALPPDDQGLAFWVESDGASSVGAPTRMAAYMNRETSATRGKSVYIGWHSNAKPEQSMPQRGALTLITNAQSSRTLLQEQLAQVLVDSIDAVMTSAQNLPHSWVVASQRIVSFINYGEIRIDNIGNEMPATIVESAFHDNAEDVDLLLDLRSRRLLSDGVLSGTIAFLRQVSGEPVPPAEDILPPGKPDLLALQAIESSPGLARIEYRIPPGGTLERVLVETGGLFDGFSVAGEAPGSGGILNLGTTAAVMVRLVAEGPGGCSLPSRVLVSGGGRPSNPRALIVTAFDAEHRSQSLRAVDPGPFNFPTGTSGTYTRVSPRMINPHDQAAEAARLVTRLGHPVDTVHRTVFESMSAEDLARYGSLIYMEGRQEVSGFGLTTATLDRITSVSETIPVLVTGSAIVRPRAQDTLRAQLAEWAGVRFNSITTETGRLLLEGAQPKTSGSVSVTHRLPAGYLPVSLDSLEPTRGNETLIVARHDEDDRRAAYVLRRIPNKPLRGILAAPLENLYPTEGRESFLRHFYTEAGLPTSRP